MSGQVELTEFLELVTTRRKPGRSIDAELHFEAVPQSILKDRGVASHSPVLQLVDRIDKDSYAMCLALVAALRSEDPVHRVGAVGLTETGRVIATGYNGLKPGKCASVAEWHDTGWRLKNVIHAEINLVSIVPPDALHTVAVTTLPCLSCAKALVAHGVKRVLYGQNYLRDPDGLTVLEYNDVETSCLPLTTVYGLIRKIRLKSR